MERILPPGQNGTETDVGSSRYLETVYGFLCPFEPAPAPPPTRTPPAPAPGHGPVHARADRPASLNDAAPGWAVAGGFGMPIMVR